MRLLLKQIFRSLFLAGAVILLPFGLQALIPSWRAKYIAPSYPVVAAILALSLVFGMAWWTTRKTQQSRNVWAATLAAPSAPQGSLLRQGWEVACFTAVFSFFSGLMNLSSFRIQEGIYSDGAIILQLLRNSPLALYRRTVLQLHATLVTPQPIGEVDLESVQRSATTFAT